MKNIKLKMAIFSAGATQRKIAQEAGIPEAHLSMAINGRYNLDPIQKTKIAESLRRSEQELFGVEKGDI